jgi:hypothetical protein
MSRDKGVAYLPQSAHQRKERWMKRAIMLVAFVAALGLLSFGTVTASPSKVTTRHVPTAILHDADVLLSDGQSVISGHLRTRLVCRRGREVRLKTFGPDGITSHPDADLTSINGAWAVKANIDGVSLLKATVTRRNNGVHRDINRRTICEAASVTWRPD